MLVLGEVHTGLLQHATSVTSSQAKTVLGLRIGEVVRTFERPVAYAVSPDLFTGVDCRLESGSAASPRAVGTTMSRAALTGGQIVQTSTTAHLSVSPAVRRMPWPYYLSRPGQVETIGKTGWDAVAAGFLAASSGDGLDLGAITGRLLDAVQRSPQLDRRAPFRTARTRLRWVLVPREAAGDQIGFSIESPSVRTLRVAADLPPARVAGFCEDVARHDWLLTALLAIVERSRIDLGTDANVVRRLRPAIDHLLHLWMPAARLEEPFLSFWAALERGSGFTRQWETQVSRIRDQLAVHTISLLRVTAAQVRESV